MKHTLREWVIATRPWSFPASAMPVAVSMAFLWWQRGDINWIAGLWAMLNIIVFHAAGNTWSDYHDYAHGVDASDTFGSKTLTSGQFEPAEIRRLSIALCTVACLMGLGLMLYTGWELIYAGVAGVLCTLLYPALKFRAMGDYLIFIAYAAVPTIGTAFVCTGVYDPQMWVVALPVGLITVAILHCNNARDIATDRRAGISTLAMQVGSRWSRVFYLAEVLLPYALLIVFAATGRMHWMVLLTLLSLPIALGNSRQMLASRDEGVAAISTLDEMTAKLQLAFSVLLTLSLVIAAFL